MGHNLTSVTSPTLNTGYKLQASVSKTVKLDTHVTSTSQALFYANTRNRLHPYLHICLSFYAITVVMGKNANEAYCI